MELTFDHKEQLSSTVYTFWFRPNGKLDYIAGQYAELWLPHANMDNRGDKRMFSLSSSPHESLIGMTMAYDPTHGSSFKRTLLTLNPGSIVRLTTLPMGDFILPIDPRVPLVYIAGGVGIAPVYSMVSWLVARGEQRTITLEYLVRNTDNLLYQDLFTSQPITYLPLIAETAQERKTVPELIDAVHPPTNGMYYLSGPSGLVENLMAELLTRGIPRTQIVLDIFTGYDTLA